MFTSRLATNLFLVTGAESVPYRCVRAEPSWAHALVGVSLAFRFIMFVQHVAAGDIGGVVASSVVRAIGAGDWQRVNVFPHCLRQRGVYLHVDSSGQCGARHR